MDLNYFMIKHGELTIEFNMRKPQLKSDEKERGDFKKKIADLFSEIDLFINGTGNLGYYGKLIYTEKYWQEAFSNYLGRELDLALKIDRSKLKVLDEAPDQTNDIDQTFYDEKALQKWLDIRAYEIYHHRCFSDVLRNLEKPGNQYQSTNIPCDEDKKNWHTAEVHFASDILNGRICFGTKVDPEAYYHLENIWVKEVKELDAFFIWNDILHYWDDGKREYHRASEYLRLMLEINVDKEFFKKAENYIKSRYLYSGNKIDFSKKYTKDMLEKKAYQIACSTGSWEKGIENWNKAVHYVTMFYENIIPAINNDNKESILMVLKAFQYSNAAQPEYAIINCFEAALVIYFIKNEIIKKLWDNSAGESLPVPPDVSRVSINLDPRIYILTGKLPGKLFYDNQRGELGFYGIMHEAELNILQQVLPKDIPENRSIHQAIDKLYKKSRLLPKELTL